MVERVLVEVPVLLDWFVVDLHFDRTPELMKIVKPRSGIVLHQAFKVGFHGELNVRMFPIDEVEEVIKVSW